MSEALANIVKVWMKIFVIFTPFFVLSVFLSMTQGWDERRRRRLAFKTTRAVAVFAFVIFFLWHPISALFGITLDAFRIGAGALLFLSAVELVQVRLPVAAPDDADDIAVVPLAMPIVVGPAVVGTLLVLSADMTTASAKAFGCVALALAIVALGALLWAASSVERVMGRSRIIVLAKITGLILSALAAQMIFTGARNFLAGS